MGFSEKIPNDTYLLFVIVLNNTTDYEVKKVNNANQGLKD